MHVSRQVQGVDCMRCSIWSRCAGCAAERPPVSAGVTRTSTSGPGYRRAAPAVRRWLVAGPPKSDAGRRVIALDATMVAAPRAHRSGQREDRNLDPAELVLWAVLSYHHFPRPEDRPVLPVARARRRLESDGFFGIRRPALDVQVLHSDATDR